MICSMHGQLLACVPTSYREAAARASMDVDEEFILSIRSRVSCAVPYLPGFRGALDNADSCRVDNVVSGVRRSNYMQQYRGT